MTEHYSERNHPNRRKEDYEPKATHAGHAPITFTAGVTINIGRVVVAPEADNEQADDLKQVLKAVSEANNEPSSG